MGDCARTPRVHELAITESVVSAVESEVEDFFSACACGSPDLEYSSGRELRIVQVEMV